MALLRIGQVSQETGLAQSTIYLKISNGLLPRPVRIGPRLSGWPSNEIEAINRAYMQGKSEDEIKALVEQLEAARSAAA